VVGISAPASGSSFDLGASIDFTGTAEDTEDGTISANLNWISSINGGIGSGASFATTSLAQGVHTITASVIDSGGLSGSDAITISVGTANTSPTVAITAPADGSAFDEGTSISFFGTAGDAEDGTISANLSWTSDSSPIGTGASISATLPVGAHTIEATVTDSGGLAASATITVTVNAATNTAPVVVITNPSNNATFNQTQSIPFTGTAADAEDGPISANLSWTSDGLPIGTGASISATLPVGLHTIEASVTDSGGLLGSDAITVNIVPAPTDSFTDVVAEYKAQPDRLRIDVVSSDTSGNRVITVTMDQTGNGTFDRALGTASWLSGGRYRLNIQPFPNPNPTANSRLRITSDLGASIELDVTID